MIAVLIFTVLYITAVLVAGRLKALRKSQPHWRVYMFLAFVLSFGIGFLNPIVWGFVEFGLLLYALGAAAHELRQRKLYFREQGIRLP
jgi:hypothetical protein